jgi:putative ABC transport system permease protein
MFGYRKKRERDLEEEIQSHLQLAMQDRVGNGEPPEHAAVSARREFGNTTLIKETAREVWVWTWLESLMQDVRFSIRSLSRAPAFTATAIAALALGIGANTAVFSVVNTVLLKPVPAPDPDRVVIFITTRPEVPIVGASEARFNTWRKQTALFENISAYRYGTINLTRIDTPEQLQMAQVSSDYFRLFGLSIARGRAFSFAEDLPNAGHFAVISDAFWKRVCAADPHAVGRKISLNGTPYVVLGVMAPGTETESPLPVDVWVPFQIDPESTDQNHYFTVAGRIKPGVARATVNAKLGIVADDFRRRFPNVSTMLPGYSFDVEPLRDAVAGDVRSSLLVLAAAVSFVLLIACANVANLLLVRAAGRQREIAIRGALGAGRARIVRQLLTESLTLSLAGGALGLVLGVAGIHALLTLNPGNIPRIGPYGSAVTADWRVLTLTVVVSFVTGIVFGIIPALQTSGADLSTSLKESSGRSGTGLHQTKTRSVLVAAEIGLALILAVGSGLLIRTFVSMRSVTPGFVTHNVLTLQVSLSGEQYRKTAGVARLMRASIERIRSLPGVEAAAAGCCLPIGPVPNGPFVLVGRPLNGSFHSRAGMPIVTPDFFDVFEIPILRGRAFTERDDAQAPGVAIVSDGMARRFWPEYPRGRGPVGAQIILGSANSPEAHPLEIVGVAGEVHERTDRLTDPYAYPYTLYLPQAQSSDGYTAYTGRSPTVWAVRTRVDSDSLRSAIKSTLEQEARLPVVNVRPMDEIVARSTARQDFNLALMSVFGFLALSLAAIGVYGLIAWTVQQRTREIGIRLALGAESGSVRRLVVFDGMRLTLIGVAVGEIAAFGLSRFLASFLYGVQPRDPMAFVAAPVLLTAIALAAVWFPARRASRIHPADALRHE